MLLNSTAIPAVETAGDLGANPERKSDMITFYGVTGCPDCEYVKTQVQGNPEFHYVNVGENISNFKAFLKLRDNDPAFDEAKAAGRAGVPCFVREDGSVTLNKEEVGIAPRPQDAPLAGQACSLDGTGC